MSIAPRPHTSPSISSPPNGSFDQPSGLTGTTSVWPIRHSVGAVGSWPSMRATIDVRPGRLSKRCHVESRAFEIRLQEIGVADLVPGVGGAVVDALVADQRLQQLGGRSGEGLDVRHGPEPMGSRRPCQPRPDPPPTPGAGCSSGCCRGTVASPTAGCSRRTPSRRQSRPARSTWAQRVGVVDGERAQDDPLADDGRLVGEGSVLANRPDRAGWQGRNGHGSASRTARISSP